MRIALLTDPPSDHHLKLAAQVGVTDIVATYPGPKLDDLLRLRDRIASHELKLSVIERLIPHDQIVHGGPGRDEQIANFKDLIGHMGKAGVEVLCYNWMPDDDWQRTSVDIPQRGGALVTAYDHDQAEAQGPCRKNPTPADQLWANLEMFLKQVVPVATDCGVKLALHPDDPPLAMSRGQARIIINTDAFERVVHLVESPVNGLCFCQGTFASGGEDIVAGM